MSFVSYDFEPNPLIVGAQFFAYASKVSDTDEEPFKKAIREVLAPSFRRNFSMGGRPPWEPAAEATIKEKGYKGHGRKKVMIRTGRLRTVSGQMGIWYINASNSEAYVSRGQLESRGVFYGALHNEGYVDGNGNQVPARSWALIQDEDEAKVEEIFDEWVGKAGLEVGLPSI